MHQYSRSQIKTSSVNVWSCICPQPCLSSSIHTSRDHGPWTRVLLLTPVFTGREHGRQKYHPCSRAVITSLELQSLWESSMLTEKPQRKPVGRTCLADIEVQPRVVAWRTRGMGATIEGLGVQTPKFGLTPNPIIKNLTPNFNVVVLLTGEHEISETGWQKSTKFFPLISIPSFYIRQRGP